MKYANWEEFAEYGCRHEIKVAVTGNEYYNMHEWCQTQESPGVYYCTFMSDDADWSTPMGVLAGHGGFYFSDHGSAVLFALRWAGELCTTV